MLIHLLWSQWCFQVVWETVIPVWAPKFWRPKNTFQVSFSKLYFNKKHVEIQISDFTMHLIISKWLRIPKCRQKKKTMRQRGWSERRNCQGKCFHSFSYIIDHKSICFFYVNSLHCFVWFLLYYLQHRLSSERFAALTRLQPYTFFIWIYEFFKNQPQRRVFRNVRLSNLENVLQRNLRTGKARECILRVSGGTNFENFSAQRQPWQHLRGFNVYRSAQKNSGYVTGSYISSNHVNCLHY